jgi:ATP-dependent RNA helicase DDX19/DBP5
MCLAQAHNGSGKTTCFILGMLARVDPTLPAPQALCVCPTRELVVQNLMVLERMAKFTKITATSTAAADFEFSRCVFSLLKYCEGGSFVHNV